MGTRPIITSRVGALNPYCAAVSPGPGTCAKTSTPGTAGRTSNRAFVPNANTGMGPSSASGAHTYRRTDSGIGAKRSRQVDRVPREQLDDDMRALGRKRLADPLANPVVAGFVERVATPRRVSPGATEIRPCSSPSAVAASRPDGARIASRPRLELRIRASGIQPQDDGVEFGQGGHRCRARGSSPCLPRSVPFRDSPRTSVTARAAPLGRRSGIRRSRDPTGPRVLSSRGRPSPLALRLKPVAVPAEVQCPDLLAASCRPDRPR